VPLVFPAAALLTVAVVYYRLLVSSLYLDASLLSAPKRRPGDS